MLPIRSLFFLNQQIDFVIVFINIPKRTKKERKHASRSHKG